MGVFKIADESATTVFGQSLPLKVSISGLRLPKNATVFFGLNEVLFYTFKTPPMDWRRSEIFYSCKMF